MAMDRNLAVLIQRGHAQILGYPWGLYQTAVTLALEADAARQRER